MEMLYCFIPWLRIIPIYNTLPIYYNIINIITNYDIIMKFLIYIQ